MFAATPPIEGVGFLVSDAATLEQGHKKRGHGKKSMMINDVSHAFFEAKATRHICVELPKEDLEHGEEDQDLVGFLEMSLYGTRDAAANFQKEVRRTMHKMGFRMGRYNVSMFYHQQREIKTLVHGDDFISTGDKQDLEWMKKQLEDRFTIKTQTLGPDPDQEK